MSPPSHKNKNESGKDGLQNDLGNQLIQASRDVLIEVIRIIPFILPLLIE